MFVVCCRRLDSYEVLVISTALIPFFMFLIPFCPTLPTLALALGAMGLYMGAVDCLATLNIIQTFEERVAPFLQVKSARRNVSLQCCHFSVSLFHIVTESPDAALTKRDNGLPLITIEYHSVSMIFQQDSVVLSKVI